jgi:hypothetical protein
MAIIIGIVKIEQERRRHPRSFWARPSLIRGRQKNNTDEFMKDLLIVEVDQLNLEYRCDLSFRHFFRMNIFNFENIFSMIALKIIKKSLNSDKPF